MEPAKTIIAALGGDTAVSTFLGCHRTWVARWKIATPHGTGGNIPLRFIPRLLAEARARGLGLSAEDFLPRS
jgi:hypothetical protein